MCPSTGQCNVDAGSSGVCGIFSVQRAWTKYSCSLSSTGFVEVGFG